MDGPFFGKQVQPSIGESMVQGEPFSIDVKGQEDSAFDLCDVDPLLAVRTKGYIGRIHSLDSNALNHGTAWVDYGDITLAIYRDIEVAIGAERHPVRSAPSAGFVRVNDITE